MPPTTLVKKGETLKKKEGGKRKMESKRVDYSQEGKKLRYTECVE
jgi:hypothetical protein